MRIQNIVVTAALLLSGCAALSSDSDQKRNSTEIQSDRNIENVINVNGMDVYVYARSEILNGTKKVPLILYMCGTGCDPQEQPLESGYEDLAEKEDLIVISPDYHNASTYSETDRLVNLVQTVSENYPVDATRVYSLGFSNGGAASVALTSEYPQLFAGIAAYGWMVDLRNKDNGYEMPFQVVQGTKEFTISDKDGNPAVMKDEQQAIHSLFVYDHMIDESSEPNYEETPYWGYRPSDVHIEENNGVIWTISDYLKEGYQNPYVQFLLVDGADHIPHREEAEYSWSFLHHFSRSLNGSIVED